MKDSKSMPLMPTATTPRSTANFLQELVNESVPSSPIANLPRRAAPMGMYERWLSTLAYLSIFGLAVLIWWIGAQFTLAFLAGLGLNLAALGTAQWFIPIIITAIEVACWPRRAINQHVLAVFALVGGLDLITSVIGCVRWLSNQQLPLSSAWLWIFSVVIAALCAFWPERLARAAVGELGRLWR
ncbi:hypothetical protein [Herpetosiphon giganteus]|uniref:hypothetical protein n=1 Tax=Herpetosiphon giganteus TaxID=2029754 RepID=UPI001959F8D2|nr:hypothetical protein [Herpetosiphon giganteus]MBM7844181.1 hypothetical protein [Herpetosiphon giganteus]